MLRPSFTVDTMCPESGQAKGPEPVVYLVFSDESDAGDVQGVVVVAAVLINPDSQWDAVREDMDRLVREKVPEEKRSRFEFHAHNLFGQLGRASNKNLLTGLLSIPFRRSLLIFWGAVNRKAFAESTAGKATDPKHRAVLTQSLAFSLCAVRIENLMRSVIPGQKLLWIADNTRAGEAMKTTLKLCQEFPILPDIPFTQLDHVIDTIYFGHSNESRGLQLADACNFVIRRHLIGKADIEPFYRLIETQIVRAVFYTRQT